MSSFMNFSLSLANMSSLLSPGPAASVEFSMVAMGTVVAAASGAIMDACLNVMVGRGTCNTAWPWWALLPSAASLSSTGDIHSCSRAMTASFTLCVRAVEPRGYV